MKASVIISTYNSPEWLKKTLWGFRSQFEKDFEVVIADDGSKSDTKELIQSFNDKFKYPIKHIWHEDNGFRKTIILNKAILASSADYLIFTDGDCIPRNDFVSQHLERRRPGYFLSGGYYKLPMDISRQISEEDITLQNCFKLDWLKERGLPRSVKNLKLVASGWRQDNLFNRLTPTEASWNGHNSSGWKANILEVNGFDERMGYGSEDREMGERLWNSGIKSKGIRYSAICVHLDHARGYVNDETLKFNRKIHNETRQTKKRKTEHGIYPA